MLLFEKRLTGLGGLYLADLRLREVCCHKLLAGGHVHSIHVGEAHRGGCTGQIHLHTPNTTQRQREQT